MILDKSGSKRKKKNLPEERQAVLKELRVILKRMCGRGNTQTKYDKARLVIPLHSL